MAFTHMSNVLGTINPAEEIIRLAHAAGALTLVDGAQSVPHLRWMCSRLDADFLAFSAHKMCGPTGIGVLYGRKDLLDGMPPFLGGGDMIKSVFLRSFAPNDVPYKFEAGTPAIAEAHRFGRGGGLPEQVGMAAIAAHEHEIIAYALERLEEVPGVSVFGPAAQHKGGVAAFTLERRPPARYRPDPGYLRGGRPRRASLRHAAAREISAACHGTRQLLPVQSTRRSGPPGGCPV